MVHCHGKITENKTTYELTENRQLIGSNQFESVAGEESQ